LVVTIPKQSDLWQPFSEKNGAASTREQAKQTFLLSLCDMKYELKILEMILQTSHWHAKEKRQNHMLT
jgi:hypothetical protein